MKAKISNITTVTLTWSSVKNADHYTVEIYEGTDFAPAVPVNTAEVPVSDDVIVVYSYVLPAGDTQFSARVKAVSSLTGVEESKVVTGGVQDCPGEPVYWL